MTAICLTSRFRDVSLLFFHRLFEMSQLPLWCPKSDVVLEHCEEQLRWSLSSSLGIPTLPKQASARLALRLKKKEKGVRGRLAREMVTLDRICFRGKTGLLPVRLEEWRRGC